MKSTHTPSVSVDGLRIHYERAGQGAAVVLLHGSGSSLEGFERVAALLSAVHELLRPRQTDVITQCGHLAPYERPDDVGDLLASFAVPHPDRIKP